MRTHEDLLRQNDELAVLHDTTLDLIDGLDLESLLEAVVVRAVALVGIESGYLYVADDEDPGPGSGWQRVGAANSSASRRPLARASPDACSRRASR